MLNVSCFQRHVADNFLALQEQRLYAVVRRCRKASVRWHATAG